MRAHRLSHIVLALAFALPLAARADLQVRSPLVDYRELEIEFSGLTTFNRKGSATNGAQSYNLSVGYGVLPFWKIELEGESGATPGQNLRYQATTIENTFQLTPEGKYFVNLGLFAEYSQSAQRDVPNAFVFGPIVQKELNDVLGVDSLHTLNLFLAREIGHNHGHATGFEYAWQSKLLLHPLANPGIELYGAIADIAHTGRVADQTHSIGPVVTGAVSLAPLGNLRYEIGYQFGLSSATARGGVRWKLEYEIAF